MAESTVGLAKGKIQTVSGPIEPSKLGQTLCHEHLYHRATGDLFSPRPPDPKYAHLINAPYDVDNLWWINFHPYSNKDNLCFTDVEAQEAIREELIFLNENTKIKSIVECTTFGSDPTILRSLSNETGINIIAGTGYYVNMSVPSILQEQSIEDIYLKMKNELEYGINSTKIKAGIIGEIGTCYPIHPFEKKVLRAAALVHNETPNVPISIHPGRNKDAPYECLRVILEAGANPEKIVMCHLDRTLFSKDNEVLEFAESTKCILEFDLFGLETSYYELSDDLDIPNDADRIIRLKELIDEGHRERVVVSHDIHTKQRLMAFGGHGFGHISLNALPKMKMRGFTDDDINYIMKINPRKWLTL